MKTRLILVLSALAAVGSHALSLRLKEHFANRPDDWITSQEYSWDLKVYITKEYTLDDVWSEEDNYTGDANRPANADVERLDIDTYMNTFFGPEPTKDKWFVVIINSAEDDYGLETILYFRILADYLQG